LASGSVSRVNAHLSIINGTAFADLLGVNLAPYLGAKLTITDSGNKTLIGYIKAAGTGELFSGQLFPDPAFNTGTGWTFDASWTVTGGSATHTAAAASQLYPTSFGQAGLYPGRLYKLGVTVITLNTGYANFVDYNGMGFGLSLGSNTFYGTINSVGDHPLFWASANAVLQNSSCYQVIAPSATGATIVSSAGGSVYNWTSEQSGFSRNDAAGYNYKIEL